MSKRLTKGNDTILFGVCSGLAEYIGMDPTIMRLIWIFLTCMYGIGVVPYLLCALIMPKN